VIFVKSSALVYRAAVPLTARERARIGVTADIKEAARRQLAEVGAAALSVRAVARDLGMVSSAVYRYFPSRDDLLTALIVDAYDAVGAAAEEAMAAATGDIEHRWLVLARAIRRWALDNPHDYALLYGSPVPGYRAPDVTIGPATRVSAVALGLVADAHAGAASVSTVPVPKSVHADFARLRDEIAPRVNDELLGRALQAWAQLFGSISFELFGHLHGVISDHDAYFDHQMRRAGKLLASRR
jgi:AcrR family transcriptional regulator